MAETIAQQFTLDVDGTVTGLGRAAKAAEDLDKALASTAQAAQGNFAKAAQSAATFENNLAAARQQQAATQSLLVAQASELRKLTAAERDLNRERKKNSSSDEQERISKLLKQNQAEQKRITQAIGDSKRAVEQERAAVDRVRQARQAEVQQTRLSAAASRDAAAAAKLQSDATKDSSGATSNLKEAFTRAGGLAAGFFAVDQVASFIKNIVTTRAEFERLEAVLTNNFGGNNGRAKLALATVGQFALDTGQNVTEVTETFVKLVNRGIEPTRRQLEQLSDISASSGKSVDQFVEALLDAQTGEFERLKEFGIKSKQSGDVVKFTFKGVTTEVQNSSQAIADYLFGLGNLQGVMGSTANTAELTSGAFGKLKGAFTELFDVIGSGTNGPLTSFITKLAKGTRNITDFFKSTDRRAIEGAVEGVEAYNGQLAILIKQTEVNAARKGVPAGEAVEQVLTAQQGRLQEQLVIAKQVLKATEAEIEDSILPSYIQRQDRDTQAQRVALLNGELDVLAKVRESRSKAAADQQKDNGLIEKQQKLIKQLQDRQKDAAQENQGGGGDFLFGKGGLNEQLVVAQKELDRLLGKVEKARKGPADRLAAALKALRQEEATLTGLAEKASIKQADDAKQRAEEQLAADLRAVEIVKQKLIEREQAVRKAGGKGARADGVIDGTQEAQLDLLREAAQRKFAEEIVKIEQTKFDQLLSLQADSYEKERELIERRYEKERAAAIGQSDVLQALEAAKQRDLLALEASFDQKRNEQRRAVATANTEANGVVSGRGTGRSVFQAADQQRLEQLEIDRQFYQQQIEDSVKAEAQKGELIRAEARKQLLLLQKERDEVLKASNQFSVYKLILGDADSPESRESLDAAVGQIATLYSEVLAASQAAADQRIAIADQNISELQTQIAAEIQLNKDGAASNIAGLQEEIEQEKQARRQAIIEKRRAAREQVIIDTITQASSVATAAARALAELPIPLNFVVAGLTVATFIASKVRAFNAASKAPAGFFKGGYTGDGNPHQESAAVGARPYVYHKAEYVIPHEPTAKFRFPLLEPLHKGDYDRIDWQAPAMRPLLASMPQLNPKLPGKLQNTMAAVQQLKVSHSLAPMQGKFEEMAAELREVKKNTSRIPEYLVYLDEEGNMVREHTKTGSKTVYAKK